LKIEKVLESESSETAAELFVGRATGAAAATTEAEVEAVFIILLLKKDKINHFNILPENPVVKINLLSKRCT
jgi:hypothetical protein